MATSAVQCVIYYQAKSDDLQKFFVFKKIDRCIQKDRQMYKYKNRLMYKSKNKKMDKYKNRKIDRSINKLYRQIDSYM